MVARLFHKPAHVNLRPFWVVTHFDSDLARNRNSAIIDALGVQANFQRT